MDGNVSVLYTSPEAIIDRRRSPVLQHMWREMIKGCHKTAFWLQYVIYDLL